jgi:hypothetical protein
MGPGSVGCIGAAGLPARPLNANNHLTEVRHLAIKLGVENDPYFAVLKFGVGSSQESA